MDDTQLWRELGQQFRVDSVRCAAAANSGHPTSGMSGADLMAVLLAKYLRYDWDNPDAATNDRLVFSKGHASTLLYAMFRAAGAITDEELLTYRQFGSMLEGHPTPLIPWVDVATGSLGQGLPLGVGMAIAGKYLDLLPYRVWVLCGDSESAEGSIWEAFQHASHYELDNLTAIFDVNRLGQRGPTMDEWELDHYRARAEAFGWHAIEIDGHDVEAIDAAYAEAVATSGKPTVVLARTVKGRGVKAVENKEGWHGKPLDDPDAAIEELGGLRNITVDVAKPEAGEPHRFETGSLELPRYEVGSEVATRKAYGDALAALGSARGDVVAIDGEVSNSTFAEIFKAAHPDRFFEMYIAEQQMAAAAVGLQARGYARLRVVVRRLPLSRLRLHPHGGDLARDAVPRRVARGDLDRRGRPVADGARGHGLDPRRAQLDGAASVRRRIRPRSSSRRWPISKGSPTSGRCGRTRRCSTGPTRSSRSAAAACVREGDAVTIVGCGITVHEALKAAERLEGARVIDCYSIKPIDGATLAAAARETGKLVDRRGPLARGRPRRSRARGAGRAGGSARDPPPRRPGDATLRQARRAPARVRDRRGRDRGGREAVT